MQIEFEFDEDDDKRNTLLSPSSRPAATDAFVPVGELAQAVVLKLASEFPKIRCGRPSGRGSKDRPL